ncbi:AMP-binding protein [Rhodobacteraceae bacterium NNCM2]|nr:AMP-binding protein [Coraliihabitans acroporae]
MTLPDLEIRDPEAREASLFECLRAQIRDIEARAPGLAAHLAGVDAGAVTDRSALARLPVLRKSALMKMQAVSPPFGGLTTRPANEFTWMFQSPGPIYEPGMDIPDWWRFARALRAAGIGPGDVIHNSFAYHLTPAGQMFENGAKAVGAAVIAGGVGNTEAQVIAASDLGATAYAGTPDFLNVMLEKAAELGRVLRIATALVSGGPLFPSLRQSYTDRGIACLQCYGTADLGLIAYETGGPDGSNPGMVVDEGVILEIVRPGTGDPVADGEVGEVLVTVLNPDYPLVRFATGDMSAVLAGQSPCGRTNMRIKGWMGRADQTTKVKGMFVRPEQIAEITRRLSLDKARLTVDREGEADVMHLAYEGEAAAEAVETALRDVLKLRGTAGRVEPGGLPNDGKVIDDVRKFD